MKNPTAVAVIVTGTVILCVGAVTAVAANYDKPTSAQVAKDITATTPTACIDALDVAEQIITLGGEAIGLSADAIEAASAWDSDALFAYADDLDGLNADLEPLVTEYQSLRAECEGAAA